MFVSILLLSGLIIVGPATAQYTAYVSDDGQVTRCLIPVKGITSTIDGEGNLISEALNVGSVSVIVSPTGDLLEVNGPGTRSYYGGKIDRIGDVGFSYYKGRIDRIGDVGFSYYYGKIDRIGDVGFSYYKGKIDRIGDVGFSYYYGKIDSIGDVGFSYYKGKIERIGGDRFSNYYGKIDRISGSDSRINVIA